MPDRYNIASGDSVAPDRPVRGAGIITHRGQTQTYSFIAKGGEIWFVGIGPCSGAPIDFDLRDPKGKSIASRTGCGDNLGPLTTGDSGTYSIVATADSAARFAFILRPTRFDSYRIAIGDSVGSNRPSAGAGVIATPGERQSFTFSATRGAIVYVKVGPCNGAGMSFDLTAVSGAFVGGKSGCNDLGPMTLTAGGAYRITTNAGPGTANYRFVLLGTTLDRYTIKIGDTVSPGHPTGGGGIISHLGERQWYSFSAPAGATVTVKVGPCAGAPMTFDLWSESGKWLGGKDACGDFGPMKLLSAGTYRIVTSADRGSARYTFSLLSATAGR